MEGAGYMYEIVKDKPHLNKAAHKPLHIQLISKCKFLPQILGITFISFSSHISHSHPLIFWIRHIILPFCTNIFFN